MSTYRSLTALLAKELRVIRTGLVIALPICLLQAMTFLMWGRLGYVLYMAAGALAVALAGALVDYRFRVDSLFASLPIRRELVVAARYLWCAVAVALMLGLTIGEARGLAALGIRNPRDAMPAVLGVPEAILFLLVTALPLALFLPFHYRWGLGAGLARFSMALGGIALLGGAIGLIARSAGLDPAAAVRSLLGGAAAALGPEASLIVTTVGLAGLGAISYLLSARFHARRDL